MKLFNMQFHPLDEYINEYSKKNTDNTYRPVAVGKYGIRSRESIYSKELAKDYSKNKLIYKDTLTIGMGSVQIDIGVLTDDVVYSVSPAYHTFKIAGIDSKYLDYCLQSRNMDMFEKYVKKSARQGKNIDIKSWLTYEIPVYDLQTQQEIVVRIETIKSIISKLKYEQTLFEELIKSRFIEMFGDMITNPFGWEVKRFPDFAMFDCNMTTDYEKYADYPHIGIDSIEKETGRIMEYKTVKEDGVISGKYLFSPEHIIYSKIRPYLNKVAMPDFYGLCSADAYPILPIKGVTNKVYLTYVLRSEHYLEYVSHLSTRANMPKVNRKEMANYSAPIAPIELQNDFEKLYKLVSKSQSICEKKIKLYQELLDKMMDEYFNPGEE